MEAVSCRYGEHVSLPVDVGDITAVSADIYVGKPGEVYKFTENISLVDGKGTFEIPGTKTRIPLDTYSYQINVNYATGEPDKYPSPSDDCDGCSSDFPKFIVSESLDETEMVS